MAHETTHILYEWIPLMETPGGKTYQGMYHSLIVHRLSDLSQYPMIPDNAIKTPVWWSGYTERWFLANGQELKLPHKLR